MMIRKLLFVLVAVIWVIAADAQLLYRISGKDLKSPSYIVGTYHLAPSSFVDSIPGLRAAIDEVAQVCGELDMKQVRTPENTLKMTQAMMLPEGKTLQGLLTEAELGRLNGLMKELMGADLSNPMAGGQMARMTPQALTTTLTLMMYMKVHPESSFTEGIDDYLQQVGEEKGKDIMGLETVDLQVKVLFQSTTLERQKQLLMCFVDHKDYQLQLAEDLIDAYFSQRLDEIEAISDAKLNDGCDSTEEEDEMLIYGRNANWIVQMPAIMSAKPTLFVVGAAHLVGEKGVLALLRAQGYQVEGVTP